MEGIDLQVLVQAGAVGIAVLLIVYLAWQTKLYNKTINNHLYHSDETLKKSNEIQVQMVNALENNTKSVEGNTRILDRIERRMDKDQ